MVKKLNNKVINKTNITLNKEQYIFNHNLLLIYKNIFNLALKFNILCAPLFQIIVVVIVLTWQLTFSILRKKTKGRSNKARV